MLERLEFSDRNSAFIACSKLPPFECHDKSNPIEWDKVAIFRQTVSSIHRTINIYIYTELHKHDKILIGFKNKFAVQNII